jgi:cytochrome c oxidase subunit II
MGGIPLFPEAASSFASEVDALYLFIVAVSAFFTVAVSAAVVFFAFRYRRKHPEEIGAHIEGSLPLELLWSVIPTIIAMVMFAWGAKLFYEMRRAPAESMQIYAVGKQWMWKFQHTGGQREINELHVPVGRPIKVLVTSEDVLHDLYFPSFRTKIDAIPGRYQTLWFEATKPGRYHIFCAEYREGLHAPDADLPGSGQRRGPRGAHRTHQVAVASGGRKHAGARAGRGPLNQHASRAGAGRAKVSHGNARLPSAQLPVERPRPQVVAAHEGPQADRDPLSDLDLGVLLPRRPVRVQDPARSC